MGEPTSVVHATPENKGWANECGTCHTRIDISLRWGQGPTRSATREAKWQVCTQPCSPAVLLTMGGGGGENYRQDTSTQGVVRYESRKADIINDNLILFILYPLHIFT